MATAARQTNALAVCVPTIGPRAIDAFKPRPALSRLPPVHRADPEGRQRVDMTRAPSRRRMAGICAFRPCAVDAESPLPIATRDVELLGDRLRRMRKGQDWESVRSDLIESVDI